VLGLFNNAVVCLPVHRTWVCWIRPPVTAASSSSSPGRMSHWLVIHLSGIYFISPQCLKHLCGGCVQYIVASNILLCPIYCVNILLCPIYCVNILLCPIYCVNLLLCTIYCVNILLSPIYCANILLYLIYCVNILLCPIYCCVQYFVSINCCVQYQGVN